ncbi:MAG: hypothetical protein AAFY81_12060, partial [Pseudomonadota bacterium]
RRWGKSIIWLKRDEFISIQICYDKTPAHADLVWIEETLFNLGLRRCLARRADEEEAYADGADN